MTILRNSKVLLSLSSSAELALAERKMSFPAFSSLIVSCRGNILPLYSSKPNYCYERFPSNLLLQIGRREIICAGKNIPSSVPSNPGNLTGELYIFFHIYNYSNLLRHFAEFCSAKIYYSIFLLTTTLCYYLNYLKYVSRP